MCSLFELERIGMYDEAAVACLQFAERFPSHPFSEMFRLRALAYRERLEGIESVRKEYRIVATNAPNSDVGRQASDLVWLHESPSNGLIVCSMNGRGRVYLDGEMVAESTAPSKVATRRVSLSSGPHQITADCTPHPQRGWLSVHLRTAATNILTDASWQVARTRPTGWPRPETGQTAVWEDGRAPLGGPPFIGFWQFEPNAYVDAQSQWSFIRPSWDWQKAQKPVFFRRCFTIE